MSEENTGSDDGRTASASNAEGKRTAEIVSSDSLLQKRLEKMAAQAATQPLHFYPLSYRNAHMEVLFAYQEDLDAKSKAAGYRRNVGWQSIARKIIESSEKRKATDAEIKTLKNAIEAHYYSKATINESSFARIEKFIRELDTDSKLDELRAKLGRGKRYYFRDAFAGMFAAQLDVQQLEDVFELFKGKAFICFFEDAMQETWSTVLRFGSEQKSGVLDVEIFQFIGSFYDFCEAATSKGVSHLRGYAVIQEMNALELSRPDEPGNELKEGLSVCGTLMASQSFEKTFVANGFTSAWFDFRVVNDHQRRILNSEILLYSLPLPHHRIFFEMLCDSTDAVQYDPFSQMWEVEKRIGEIPGHFEQQYTEITNPPEVRYVSELSEKFDGA